MTPHLSLSQLSFLVAVALAVAAVIILIISYFHRMVRHGIGKEVSTKSAVRVDDQAAFAVAAMQAVIRSIKEEQQRTLESLQAAQDLAKDALRNLHAVAQEMDQGLIIFDRQGFIRMANPAIRSILHIDTWSRRRYPEILGRDSKLTEIVEDCLRTGKLTKGESLEHRTAGGEARPVTVSVVPLRTPNGAIEGVICLAHEPPPPSGQ